MLDTSQNTGFIQEEAKESDLFFGANDRVVHNVDIRDLNWLPYYSKGELQHGTYFDTMGCVSYAALNELEAIMNFHIRAGNFSLSNIAWLHEKGYFND